MKQDRKRPLSKTVRILRWVLVIGIFLIIIEYQVLKEYVFDFTATERMIYGLLLYAGIGSLVTWIALTWVSNRIAGGERAKQKVVEAEREIRQINLELEERIALRTKRLELANQELRRANAQLQELDKMKSEFVSMVSHSLRAPVTNINGAIELLSQTEASADDEGRNELVQIIEVESARLTRLVQGVLTVSRLEGGKFQLKREAVDIQAMCRNIIQNLDATTESHSFSFSCPDDLPLAWADDDCTEEVLVNLIDNAVKYSPAGGHIEVELREQGHYVVALVSDQGPGIEAKELDRIFERFHRVDGSDSGATGGYGLGLYISKRLIEAQGGMIEAKSTLGQGATFSFSLPIARRRHLDREVHGTS